jgi:hypothetical protein
MEYVGPVTISEQRLLSHHCGLKKPSLHNRTGYCIFQTSFYEDDRDKYHCPIPGDRRGIVTAPKEDGLWPISGGMVEEGQFLIT